MWLKFNDRKWLNLKRPLTAVTTFIETPVQVENEVPLFVYLIVSPMVFLGSLAFFKAVSTGRKLTIGNMASFSKNIILDPLPFFHIVAMAALTPLAISFPSAA